MPSHPDFRREGGTFASCGSPAPGQAAGTRAHAQAIRHFAGIYPKKSRGFLAWFCDCGSYGKGSAAPHGGTAAGRLDEAQHGQPLWLSSCLHVWRIHGRKVRGPADPLSAVTIRSAALCRTCARMPMPGAGAWACDPDSIHPQSVSGSLDVGTFALVYSQNTSRNAKRGQHNTRCTGLLDSHIRKTKNASTATAALASSALA